jgi:HMG-box domain
MSLAVAQSREPRDIITKVAHPTASAQLHKSQSLLQRSNTTTISSDIDGNGRKPMVQKIVRKWKKPVGKPKRPLSAYNMFFQLERDRIVDGAVIDETVSYSVDQVAKVRIVPTHKMPKRRERKKHGMIAFADLARLIGQKWKKLDVESRKYFEDRAKIEKNRYDLELKVWRSGAGQSNSEIGKPKISEETFAESGTTVTSQVANNLTLVDSWSLANPKRIYDDDSAAMNRYTIGGSLDYETEENLFDVVTDSLPSHEFYPGVTDLCLEDDYDFHDVDDYARTDKKMNINSDVVSPKKDTPLTSLGFQKHRCVSLTNLQQQHAVHSTAWKLDRPGSTASKSVQQHVLGFNDRVLTSDSPMLRRVSLDGTIVFPHQDTFGSNRRQSYPPQMLSNHKVLRRASIGGNCNSSASNLEKPCYGGEQHNQQEKMRMTRTGSLPIMTHHNINSNNNNGSSSFDTRLQRMIVNKHRYEQMVQNRQLHQHVLNARWKAITMRRRQLQAMKFNHRLCIEDRDNQIGFLDAALRTQHADDAHHGTMDDDISQLDFSITEEDYEIDDNDIVVNNSSNLYGNYLNCDESLLEPTPFDTDSPLLNFEHQPNNSASYVPSNYKNVDLSSMGFNDLNHFNL